MFVAALLGMLALFITPQAVTAAELEDGIYSVPYTVLQGSGDSVSIANDYFQKPATVIKVGEHQVIELTLNHSTWVQELAVKHEQSSEPVEVAAVDQEQDLRTIRFAADDLAQPIELQMHVRIEVMDPVYDHRYTVRLVVEESDMERIGEVPEQLAEDLQKANESLISPPMAILTIGIIVAIIVLFVLMMLKFRRKS